MLLIEQDGSHGVYPIDCLKADSNATICQVRKEFYIFMGIEWKHIKQASESNLVSWNNEFLISTGSLTPEIL